jgi:hypothetical protein
MNVNYKKLFILSLFCAASAMAGSEITNLSVVAEKIKELRDRVVVARNNLFSSEDANFFAVEQKDPQGFVGLIERGVLPFMERNVPGLNPQSHNRLLSIIRDSIKNLNQRFEVRNFKAIRQEMLERSGKIIYPNLRKQLADLDAFLADFNEKQPARLDAQIRTMAAAIDDIEAKKPGTGWYVTTAARQADVKARRDALEKKKSALNLKLEFVDSAAVVMYRTVIKKLSSALEKIEKDYVAAQAQYKGAKQAAQAAAARPASTPAPRPASVPVIKPQPQAPVVAPRPAPAPQPAPVPIDEEPPVYYRGMYAEFGQR